VGDVIREDLSKVREIAFQPTNEACEHVPAAYSLDAPDLLQQSAINQARRIGRRDFIGCELDGGVPTGARR
jgi:hypothetical protein